MKTLAQFANEVSSSRVSRKDGGTIQGETVSERSQVARKLATTNDELTQLKLTGTPEEVAIKESERARLANKFSELSTDEELQSIENTYLDTVRGNTQALTGEANLTGALGQPAQQTQTSTDPLQRAIDEAFADKAARESTAPAPPQVISSEQIKANTTPEIVTNPLVPQTAAQAASASGNTAPGLRSRPDPLQREIDAAFERQSGQTAEPDVTEAGVQALTGAIGAGQGQTPPVAPNGGVQSLPTSSEQAQRLPADPLRAAAQAANQAAPVIAPAQPTNSVTPQQVGIDTSRLNTQQEEFVAPLAGAAQRTAQELGTSPLAVMAIAIHETGWGKSVKGNNHFGTKSSGNEPSVNFTTSEYDENGNKLTIKDNFQTFESPEASFDGFAQFLKKYKRYKPALAAAENPEQFIRELQKAGYATDPEYASKVLAIMDRLKAGQLPPA